MHNPGQEADYGRNPYRDEPVADEAPALSHLMQVAIAVLFAVAAIYLGG